MLHGFVNRSSVQEYRLCPRSAWYTYHHAAKAGSAVGGIVKSPNPDYFDIGSAVHVGLAASLLGKDEDAAVDETLEYYKSCPDYPTRPYTQQWESSALCEGLIRAWYQNGLERFMAMYEVLYIEQGIYQPQVCVTGNQSIILHWMSRPDAIVKERQGPAIAGISWKTIDSATEYRRRYYRHDLQGLLEMHFGSDMLRRLGYNQGIDYIQTIFLQKGKRERPEDADASSDVYLPLDNPLIYAWVNKASESYPFFNEIPGITNNYAWMTRYYKPGNKTYNKLSYFERIPVPNIKSWVHALAQNRVFPTPEYNNGETALDRIVVWEEPQMRDQEQITDSLIQITFQEQQRTQAAYILSNPNIDPTLRDHYFNMYFPQNLDSCTRYGTCRHVGICQGTRLKPGDPIPENYRIRTPHHAPELEYMKGLK